MTAQPPHIEIGLNAVVVAVENGQPLALTVRDDEISALNPGLPSGPFNPNSHRTLEAGLRHWVEDQTDLSLGYVEQLYTFGDRGRLRSVNDPKLHLVSVGYLTLVRQPTILSDATNLRWVNWYDHLPWEDWRTGPPTILVNHILPALADWGRSESQADKTAWNRIQLAFGCYDDLDSYKQNHTWDEERVLERYELMYEAGLVDEVVTDGMRAATRLDTPIGIPLRHDHRRILATAMARLRGKLKYRPVVFELMPVRFTLTQLQTTVETLSGRQLHKQNFRRMIEGSGLVEPTGEKSSETGGRPAALFRYKRSIRRERPAPGIRVGPS